MSLGDVYQDALERVYELPQGWVANWPARFSRRLGEVGRVTPGGFNKDAMLSDKGINVSPDPDPGTPGGSWNFQSDKSISVAVNVNASVPGWEFIGSAKAGLKINFGSSQGIVVGIGSTHQERLVNLDALRPELLAAANSGKLTAGQAIIVEVLIADTGIVVTSEGNNATLVATTNANLGVAGSPSLAAFGVDLSVTSGSHATSQETYPQGFSVAFRVLKLGARGWWWWKQFKVRGIGPIDEEMFLTRDDYFAPFPDAEFAGLAVRCVGSGPNLRRRCTGTTAIRSWHGRDGHVRPEYADSRAV
jgi:hypothetical protein